MESLSLVYLPSAVALGALHALEPGHAKTLTAAYLIGVKGTKRDAVLLGLSVAFTHSIVVIGLSVGALWLGEEAFTTHATHTLQVGSAVVVICLGMWMVWKRLRVPQSPSSHSHGAPEPFNFDTRLASGSVQIVDTSEGERMRMSISRANKKLECVVLIQRGSAIEKLVLSKKSDGIFESDDAPADPHEFKATLALSAADERETLSFEMHEPAGHHDHGHSHDHLSDDEHARAHAATLPEYVKEGTRPTLWQIMAFGAAGGMIPCPASITVMLLALSLKKVGVGLLAVLGFSVGLAITLVGMGLLVVLGVSQLAGTGRFAWLSARAPLISAFMVVVSGVLALTWSH